MMAGARERKRAERRKRKRRPGESPASGDGQATAQAESAAPAAQETFKERMARRYEERNAEARAKLEPLEPDERPAAVTVAAIVSGVLALIFAVSAVLAIAGVDASGRDIAPAPIIVFAAVFVGMTLGMWRARYWAVLGFQTLLLLVMVASALGLVRVSTVPEAVATLALLAGSATLFYFMIRALGRIQMPRPPGAE
jgi:predicted tellurium resistance membrane protein TerC